MMEFRSVSVGDVSPDGSLVAFTVREPRIDGEESSWLTHVWIVRADGGPDDALQFTRGAESTTSPAFSPDGRILAFTTSRSGESQIWAMPVDGGEAWQVTASGTGVGSFAWSPSGDRLAFTAQDPESEERKKRAEEKRDLVYADRDFRFSHLYAVDFDRHAREPVEPERLTEGDFHVQGFDWSPDGKSIVFAHRADPRLDVANVDGDISMVDVATGNVASLVAGPGVEGSPSFSPDGAWIAYLSSGDRPEPVGLSDVWLIPASGGEPRKLAETPDRSPNLTGWSAAGDAVYFGEALGTTVHVMALPVDGSEPRPLTRGAGVVGSPEIAAGAGVLAFTWQTPDTPPDVRVTRLDRFEPRALTDLHAHVDVPAMGRTELLSWTSEDGRFEIEGLLTYPVDYEEGRRYPLILNVHGGPAGVYTQGFTGGPSIYQLQYFADRGYAVLRPNPRGSRGYGKDFRYANVRDWGYGDMDDLMAGVDEVVEMGVAHPDSLLLMGWSYGGYMTSFAVTRTDRFRAASMGAGLPNLVSMVTTTDIGNYLAAHMDGEFWEDYETYERHSAIYRIAEVETPTQVIHGAQDLRVPFTQGQEFYRALQRRGVPTEMVILPRTPHGPREPKLLMEVSPAILAWFERWLRPAGSPVTTDGGD
jgi:dipeptidyl aminopeptidase/acylaminoacyl peptidase